MTDHPHPLHGLCFIRIDPSSPLGVALHPANAAQQGEMLVARVDALPGFRLELHWFADASTAGAFVEGVRLTPRNDLAVHRDAALPNAALVGFLPEPRPRASSLDEAIALVDHGGAGKTRTAILWQGLTTEARNSGKGLRPLANYLAIDQLGETHARITMGHWHRGPANATWRVMPDDDGYVLRSARFPYARAFDGTFGSLDDTDVADLCAKHRASLTPDGELEIRVPRHGLVAHFRGLQRTLFDPLYDIFRQREALHAKCQLARDAAVRRILKALAAGALLRATPGSVALIRPDGTARRVSRPLLRRLEGAGLVRPRAGSDSSATLYDAVSFDEA